METMEVFSSVEEKLVARANAVKQPINGILELTPLCNMNCDMCYVRLSRAEMEARGRLYSGIEWLELSRQMAQAGTLFLLLTGGEPLLHPDFKEIYLGLKKMGMILTINTNGTLIDEEWAAFFGTNKPRRINITLYGADDDAYSNLCHYPGGFARTVNAIRLLRKHGVDVKINGSITPRNRKDINRIIQIAKELDVPYKLDTYMYPGTRERTLPYDQQSRLTPEEAAAAAVQISTHGKSAEEIREMQNHLESLLAQPADMRQTGFPCRAGSSSFMINWLGQMRPCVMVDRPTVPVFDLGFEEAWKRIVESCEQVRLSTKCANCDMRGACQVCAACALLETGEYSGTPEYMCRFTQKRIELMHTRLEKAHE